MEKSLDRRELLALAGGMAVVAASQEPAQAQFGQNPLAVPAVQGEWINQANNGICGIFQAGAVLLLVNENGDIATAQMQANRLSVMRGWNVVNLSGQVVANAQVIQFSNGSQWRKA